MLARVDPGDEQPGALRTANGKDGSVQVERLSETDPDRRVYRYEMVSTGMPVETYMAEFRAQDAGDGTTEVSCHAEFDVTSNDKAGSSRASEAFSAPGWRVSRLTVARPDALPKDIIGIGEVYSRRRRAEMNNLLGPADVARVLAPDLLDRLPYKQAMSAPEPRANPLLFGQEAAEASLAEAMAGGRMHHAWLITGPDGVGKATLAYRFARALLAGLPTTQGFDLDPTHPVFRRVAAGSHADLLTVERAYDEKRKRMRTQIAVDDVRRITNFMALTPAEGGWRVAVVDGAEDLNQASANALLKILEEPPPRAVLLLICAAPGRLLPTIRSRCRRLPVPALSNEAMARALKEYLPEMADEERGRLAAIAEGSPGRALLLAEEDGLAVSALVNKVLSDLPDVPPQRPHEIADALGRADNCFSTFMDLLRAAVAAAVRDTVRGRGDADQARVAGVRPLDAWGEVWQGLTRLQDETERFALDKRQALIASLGLLSRKAQ